MKVYLDNSATTCVYPQVAELMHKIMVEDYGNPSSMHYKGVEAEHYIKAAKAQIATVLKCSEKEILFTSCGTESDNLALIGCAQANKRAGKHLITTCIEHPAILETMKYLEEQGFEVTYLPVDETGRIRLADLEQALREDTILVSIMHTNNEIGALQPIAEAGELIKKKNPATLFHVDAVQGFGKYKIVPKKMHIDLLSVSGHKIHAPKGIGFLYIGEKVKIKPILFGGGQQKGMRSGTENVPSIAAIGLATELIYQDLEKEKANMYACKKALTDGILALENTRINGLYDENSAPHVVSATFVGVRAEVLLHALEDQGICVSSGSACATNHPQPSATLAAIGGDKDTMESTLRFSFSVFTTMEEITYTLEVIGKLLPMLRKFTRK